MARCLRGDPQFGTWPTIGSPRVAYAVRDWTVRLGLVAAGLGLAVLPELAGPSVPAGVTTVHVDDPAWLGRSAVAVTARDRSPAAAAAIRALKHEPAHLRDPAPIG